MSRFCKYILLVPFLVLSPEAFSQQFKYKGVEEESMKLSQLLFLVNRFYVDTVNIPKLTDKAVVSILKELDPHSTYISADDVKAMNEPIKGSFEGVGISYRMIDDTVVVNGVVANCPAERAGILPGDRIIAVDDDTIAGKGVSLSRIPKLIRGPYGSEVELHILRYGHDGILSFNMIRDKIPIHSVDAAFYVRPGIGYIKLNSFSMTTTTEVNKAISGLLDSGRLKSLVIDLQGNGGGVMSAAVNLANLFLPDNRIIVYSQGEHLKRQNSYSHSHGVPLKNKLKNVRLYLLVDEYSASASEIVAGALQDWERAVIIGRRTFGKGLVQRPFSLNDNSEVRLTIARYYTPSGRNIQKSYDAGVEKYRKDIESRYSHGEMLSPDSVAFPDSLKFKTLVTGKTVYGGGGIFPDVFVPMDTLRFTPVYRKSLASGVFFKEINRYLSSNGAALKEQYPLFSDFDRKFKPEKDVVSNIIRLSAGDPEFCGDNELQRSEYIVSLMVKATVARSLYGDECYYRIVANVNDALVKAVELYSEKK